MDRRLVVVFDSESKALEGKRALSQLDSDGSIGLWAYAIVAKNADGTSTVKQGDDAGPIGTLFGTSLGGLIGQLQMRDARGFQRSSIHGVLRQSGNGLRMSGL